MRTRHLCGLTLVVLAAHAVGWQIALGGLPRLASARAGVHRVALVNVARGVRVASALAQAGPAPIRAPAVDAAPQPAQGPPRGHPRAPVPPAQRPPTGKGATLASAPADATEWPVYATQAPPSVTLRYALVQGGLPARAASPASAAEGQASLEWTHDAATYSLRVTTALADRPSREWQSTGTFDAAGVAPVRFVERERGRDKRAINFDRDARRVRFSGASGALAVAAGAQDRWSWVVQLAAVAEAAAQRGQAATHWDLQVAGLRGELERWTFQVLPASDFPAPWRRQGNELSASGERAPGLLHVLRTAERPYDLRIEAWLSPSLHHLPAGLRMSTPPGNWSLALWQSSS
jgi:hypothetical protein